MRKKAFVMTPVVSVLVVLGAFGQDPAKPVVPAAPAQGAVSPCPRIEVQGPNPRGVRDGQTVMFVANIAGGDPKVVPQIIWSVNGGMIKAGQQTRRIEVDSTGAGAYREITADIWVGGYPGECMTQGSVSVQVFPPASKADEFGELDPEKENERLASIVAAVSQSDDLLYVIVYAGRTSVRGYAITALRRIRTQLTSGGFPVDRVIVMDGGFRDEPSYELWIVPKGAEAPRPSPTVDRKEIVYPKAVAPVRKRRT